MFATETSEVEQLSVITGRCYQLCLQQKLSFSYHKMRRIQTSSAFLTRKQKIRLQNEV